jgi:hypothetical protein
MDGNTPLSEAREWVRKHRSEKGVTCPCCGQFAKIYKRPITSSQAGALILMYRAYGREFGHAPSIVPSYEAAMVALLRYWGLIEESLESREDGGRAGWWRITPHGRDWIFGQTMVPRYAYIYNAELLDLSGPPTSIRTALGKKFDYEDLMGPARPSSEDATS